MQGKSSNYCFMHLHLPTVVLKRNVAIFRFVSQEWFVLAKKMQNFPKYPKQRLSSEISKSYCLRVCEISHRNAIFHRLDAKKISKFCSGKTIFHSGKTKFPFEQFEISCNRYRITTGWFFPVKLQLKYNYKINQNYIQNYINTIIKAGLT